MNENNPYPDLNPYSMEQKQYQPKIYESSPQHSSQVQKQLSPIQLLQEQIPKNTLDEAMSQTFCKQFSGMFYKFGYVLIPRSIKSSQSANRLKNWDLWGPFFMTLVIGLFINNGTQLSFLFSIIFIGSLIVTFNIKVLRGQISFLQSVSTLGYCIFPLFMAALIIQLMKFLQIQNKWVKNGLIAVGCVWCVICKFKLCYRWECIIAARNYVSINIPNDRKLVAVFPIVLFYVLVAAMLLYM